jgi:hypothetical protein
MTKFESIAFWVTTLAATVVSALDLFVWRP